MIRCHTFDGEVNKLHQKLFINMLKNEIRGIQNGKEMNEIFREHLDKFAMTWFI